MKASFQKYILNFKTPSGTSRGVLKQKETWFLLLKNDNKIGIGECGMFRGLSIDDRPDFEEKLKWVCNNIQLGEEDLYHKLIEFPAIQIGVEMAFKSLEANTTFELFPSEPELFEFVLLELELFSPELFVWSSFSSTGG